MVNSPSTILFTFRLSSPGRKIKFSDEVASVKAEAAKLRAQGVNKIIAVGHAGIDVDINIAKNVEDVDVVVGGHSNTFLYTGENLSLFALPYEPYDVAQI